MKRQLLDWFWRSNGEVSSIVSLPTPPTFAAPVANLTDAVGASVSQTALNTASGSAGTLRATLANPFAQRFQTLQLVGSAVAPYQWKSLSDVTRSWVGGTVITAGQKIHTQTGGTISDFHEFYHFGIKGDPDPSVSGVIGLSWTARITTGTTAKWNDIVITDTSSAGIQINDGVNANTYKLLQFDYVRVIGRTTTGEHYGTEGFYLGSTNTTNYSLIEESYIRNCFVANRTWDGLQCNGHANLLVENVTVYNVGTANNVGQRGLVQFQNVKGTVRDCVFAIAPDAGVVAANGINFENCIFISTAPLLWQDMDLDAGYGASALRDGEENTVTNCHFYVTGAATEAIDFREGFADTTFLNCTTNKAALLDDNRIGPTNVLTNTSPTTGASVPATPTFNNLDPDDDDHGIIQEAWFRTNFKGYRIS